MCPGRQALCAQGVKPYVIVRGRLEARFTRALLDDLVTHAAVEEREGRKMLGVWSDGMFFAMGPVAPITPITPGADPA